MAIAASDIKSDGYTFEDAMTSSFSTTESDKTKQYEHYLEYKFADDLESMDGIKSASVTVDIADDTNSFYTNTSETSVAAVLQLADTLSGDRAESIANFLATAVGNSTTNSITIISSDGSTLFSGTSNSASASGVSYNSQLKYKDQLVNNLSEQMYRYRFEYIKDFSQHERLVEEHKVIYESIVKKDKETASNMAKVHIDNQKKAIIRQIRLEREKNK